MNKMLNGEPLRTKWGTAKLDDKGYYRITSGKEGNNMRLLHRLIAAEYFGDWINDPDDFFDIHHIDGNKLNNCVLNLEPIPPNEHLSLHNRAENHHMFGKNHSDETKRKMSESHKGKTLSEETKLKISESRNTSGYLNVSKRKNNECKQGFTWIYQYYENGKRKSVVSVSLDKLEAKVKAKGLSWKKFEKELNK